MRKQRYQRSIAQGKDPKRVNTDTSDLDMQLLNTQVKGLKAIWADEGEEEPIKRGDDHNAIDQDMKDASSEVQSESATGKKANPELSEKLNIAINGDKVMMANSHREALIKKYGEDSVNNYIGFSYKNQPIVDKKANARKFVASIPANKYSEKFLSERKIDLKKYFTDAEFAKLHVDKLTIKAKDFINNTPLTDANVGKVTKQLSDRVAASNLPDGTKKMLNETIQSNLSKFKDAKLKAFNRQSDQEVSDFAQGNVSNIDDYAALNDSGAKSVGNTMFVKNQQALQANKMSFRNFMTPPPKDAPRAKRVFIAKRDTFIISEYKTIAAVAAKESNSFLLRPVEAIPVNRVMAVEILYNYYNEKKKANPDYTLDEAKDELYSGGTNATDDQKLLKDTFRRYTAIGLNREEYVTLLKTSSGREKLRRRAAKNNLRVRIPLPSEDNNDKKPRTKSERPVTY
tara:strand:+ start:383 stop:1753 length:1371 start_codon:yes stop_codon:yes gene_type:complete